MIEINVVEYKHRQKLDDKDVVQVIKVTTKTCYSVLAS